VKPKVHLWHALLIMSVFVLLALYVFQVNSVVKDHFAIEGMKKQAIELYDKHEALKVYVSESQSLYNLQSNSRNMGLEEVKHVTYIEPKTIKPLGLGN